MLDRLLAGVFGLALWLVFLVTLVSGLVPVLKKAEFDSLCSDAFSAMEVRGELSPDDVLALSSTLESRGFRQVLVRSDASVPYGQPQWLVVEAVLDVPLSFRAFQPDRRILPLSYRRMRLSRRILNE